MKLLSAPASPFGRKVKMTIGIKHLKDQIEIVTVDTNKGDAALNALNALGRIPTLLLDDGEALHDSHVICEYLDSIGSGPLLVPREGAARWNT